MKVSVILPVYNVENYLAESIESVLVQTCQDFEIIAVNDGSTDGSPAILEKYRDRLKIFNQANSGIAETLNRGISEASGEFIAFIDGDDLWSADKLEVQLGIMHDNPDLDATFAEMEQFLSPELNHTPERFRFDKGPLKGFAKITALIRKEVFSAYGKFIDVRHGEFVEWFDGARNKGIRYNQSTHIVAQRRIRENSMSQNPDYYPSLLKFLKSRMDEKRNEA
ncbi:glycosyltransferase [Emticicia sp. CRIBPO]|uniref:glycosyltransferase family 2 protein n=1 Tax=Emticicia sp. CRIBPO TaxID=2683258 RepID=UPI001411B855|nr:glycosyltransferase family A protein [Emticicia sp. CRIBPO]NBA85205.1 glycosyltransferase [Emticicia sp. CRIBPO]